MGMFRFERKKETKKAEDYASGDNIPVPEPPKADPFQMLINNQMILAQNQQEILNQIGDLKKTIVDLSMDPPEDEAEELSEDEIAEALEEAKKKKKK